MLSQSSSASYSYLPFVLLTIATWGLYGIFLHKGQELFGPRSDTDRLYKAFLFVGIAYVLVAVLAPVAMLLFTGSGTAWKMTSGGMTWSLIAGIVGAIGAFGVLLAFGAKGSPAVVMSLIFAGAPLVNAVISISIAKQWGQVEPAFIAGVIILVVGAFLVVLYKPKPAPHAKSEPAPIVTASTEQE